MHKMLLARAEARVAPMHGPQCLRNGGAGLVPSVSERLEAACGCAVLPACDVAESVPLASNPRSIERRSQTVGSVAGPQCLLLGVGGTACAIGESGEACVLGAGVAHGAEAPRAKGDWPPAATPAGLKAGGIGAAPATAAGWMK